MELNRDNQRSDLETNWHTENVVEIEQKNLLSIAENICTQCRYPLLGLRLLIHIICNIDAQGRVYINARRLSASLDVHYDTVTKCLKYLREIGVLWMEHH